MNDLTKREIVKLISVGDRFPFVRCENIDSVFDKVVNFGFEKKIVSLVRPEIGSGPFRIVLEGLNTTEVKQFELTPQALIINADRIFDYTKEEIYKSFIEYIPKNPEILGKNIPLLKDMLLALINSGAITYLLSPTRQKSNLTGFELELAKQLKQAYKLLLNKEYVKAAQGFRGRGYGLTPAGDDFNAGWLMGLRIQQLTEKKELSKIRHSIYTHSLGKNLLVNTFLLQAYCGWYDENWKNLVLSLYGLSDNIETALLGVLTQGETSGADTMTGFLSAWEIKI